MKNLTEGSILKSLIAIAVPTVLTNLLHTAYQLVDTYWVGRLGAEAVAAVSLSFPIIFLMISLGIGFSIAGTILVAQYKGRKDHEQIGHVATQTMALMFLVSVVCSALGYFLAEPVLSLMGAQPEVLPLAISYLQWSSLGMVFLFGFFVFQSLMRGVGEVKTPMLIVFSTVIMNAFLDPLFIFGWGPIPAYGVTGAAITTLFTQAVATVAGITILLRGEKGVFITPKNFRFDTPLIKKMFFLGMPASIEQSMKALGLTIMSFLVATFGTVVVASYGIGLRLLTFVIIPAFGLSMATSTLVGQNMGAGKPDRAGHIGKLSVQIIAMTMAVMGALFFFFAEPLAATFIKDEPAVIREAANFVRHMAFAFPLIGTQLILSGVFQGAGDTKTSMMFSIVALWMFEFPLSYLLSKHTDLGVEGLWLAYPIAALLSSSIYTVYFFRGRWKKIRLIDPQEKLEQAVREEALRDEGIQAG